MAPNASDSGCPEKDGLWAEKKRAGTSGLFLPLRDPWGHGGYGCPLLASIHTVSADYFFWFRTIVAQDVGVLGGPEKDGIWAKKKRTGRLGLFLPLRDHWGHGGYGCPLLASIHTVSADYFFWFRTIVAQDVGVLGGNENSVFGPRLVL